MMGGRCRNLKQGHSWIFLNPTTGVGGWEGGREGGGSTCLVKCLEAARANHEGGWKAKTSQKSRTLQSNI